MMQRLKIIGGKPLEGVINISGAKNAALPLMTACLLTDQPIAFHNLPRLADIKFMGSLLEQMGVTVTPTEHNTVLNAKGLNSCVAPYDIVRKMRASILVLGPLLARAHEAEVSLPGGCAIGARPVDLHLTSLEAMGAEIVLENGYIKAKAPGGLKGADITFPMITVTGTENILMAATLAKGTTRLMNAACEPEVTDLAECLIKMGAQIEGVGTHTLTIHGVEKLSGCTHTILPDRIETGSYAMAVAAVGGCVELRQTSLELLPFVDQLLAKAGVLLEPTDHGFRVTCERGTLNSVDVTTAPFPGFPTDLQAQFTTMMTQAHGSSSITETIFENRFMHVPELHRMGADITLRGNTAIVKGATPLKGAPVMATDLRASFSLLIAGLCAEGETFVNRIYHLDRGYEDIEHKLGACGAIIERQNADEEESTGIQETSAA